MTSERKGWPSASSFPRYMRCPGSYQLECALGLESPPSKWSESGNRIHTWVRDAVLGRHASTLLADDDEMERAKAIFDQVKVARGQAEELWDCKLGLPMTEQRLWMTTRAGNTVSGRFDLCFLDPAGTRALITDYKSGWRPVDPASRNDQTRVYATLAKNYYGLNEVVVAIATPLGFYPSVCRFNSDDLAASSAWLSDTVDYICSKDPIPKKPSGDACRYCPCKIECDAAMEIFMRYTTLNMKMEFPVLLDDVEVCKLVIKDIEEKAKLALKADPEAIPGWTLKPGAARRSIKSVNDLSKRLVSDKFTIESLMQCCRVKIGAVEKDFAASVGIKGKKEVKNLFQAKAGDLITMSTPEPSLVRATAEEEEAGAEEAGE